MIRALPRSLIIPVAQRDYLKRTITVLDALGAGYDLEVARKALLNLGERKYLTKDLKVIRSLIYFKA